jgi:hypothetical protein
MKAMKDNAMADGGKGGWELSEQAINHLSMTGFLAIGGQDSAA